MTVVSVPAKKERTGMRKLCTYDADPTRRAIFEYDRLVRSMYTLCYLRDPKLRHVHRSQNRIESYHQLRSAIAQVFYNSAILSRLLARAEATGNEKLLALATSTSPVAWRHVHLGGRYAFRDGGQAIDLDAIVQGLKLE